MQALIEFASFALKLLLLTIAVILVISLIVRLIATARGGRRTLVIPYRNAVARASDPLRRAAWRPAQFKAHAKKRRAEQKAAANKPKPRVWVLEFDGDPRASNVPTLKDEITAVLNVAQDDDEVMIRVNSSGGTVVGYGLAATHLDRIRRANLRLTAAVDEAAASGGYLMASVANEIIAAPFSVVGSIGVIATIPNAHKLLEEKGIEILEFTAGEHKRTVTPFSEVTEERRRKLLEQLSDIHILFKDFVSVRRPNLSIDEVATGEYWFGTRALELGLIDRLMTSDEWMLEKMETHDVYLIRTLTPGAKLLTHADRLARALGSRLQRFSSADDDTLNIPKF